MLPYGYWQRPAKDLAIIHPVGTQTGNRGYIQIKRDGKTVLLHRWLWEQLVGPIPAGQELDHKNGKRNDCRISNLRIVKKIGNMRNRAKPKNNTSGTTGVGRYVMRGVPYWVATWNCPLTQKTRQKTFNINKYGESQAEQMARDHRAAVLADLQTNHGYTQRHGL